MILKPIVKECQLLTEKPTSEERAWYKDMGYKLVEHGDITYVSGWRCPTMAEQVPGLLDRDRPMSKYRVLERWFGGGWYDTLPAERLYLVEEEPAPVDIYWDAFIAGYTEWLCETSGLPSPDWVWHPKRHLGHFWSPEASTSEHSAIGSHILDGAAPWFADRGVLTSNQALLDSKYFIHQDVAAMGYGEHAERTRPTCEEMGEDDSSDGWAVRSLSELSVRLERKRASVWVHIPSGGYGMSYRTVISECRRIDTRNVLLGLESEMAVEYGWADGWVSKAAYQIHTTSQADCVGDLAHTVWHHPGLTVGCSPAERLLALKAMSAWEATIDDVAWLLTVTEINNQDQLYELLYRWFPYGNKADRLTAETKQAIADAFLNQQEHNVDTLH